MRPGFLLAVGLALAVTASEAAAEAPRGFREEQLAFARVRQAVEKKREKMRGLFEQRGLPFPAPEIYLRAFKQEGVLELWASATKGGRHELVASWPICARSGDLGPKRREGDGQVPEGFYELNHFNPLSNFHLSLGVSYPNAADRILGHKPALGGAIYLHGSCVTIGCIPIEDEGIEELYVAAMEARAAGQARIPIHVFPARLTEAKLRELGESHQESPELARFWAELAPAYVHFEKEHRLPCIRVGADGRYRVNPSCSPVNGATSKPPGTKRTR